MPRTIRATIALASAAAMLAVPTAAAAGGATSPSSTGTLPVVAEDRTTLEQAAEAYMLKAHNDQRRAGNTRNGDTHTDVSAQPRMQAWTDIAVVARVWSDQMTFDNFAHNPIYGQQYGHRNRWGENIVMGTIKQARFGDPTKAEVISTAERLMQNWWNSTGHRLNWMRSSFDQFSVGVAVSKQPVDFGWGAEDYWVLRATTNFRGHDGSRIASPHRSYPTDGTYPFRGSDLSGISGPTTTSDDGARYRDVPTSHMFHDNIEAMAKAGITKGCGGDKFCPNRNMTRGEFAAFMDRGLGLADGTKDFSDTRGHLFHRNVAALAKAGITKGCGGDRFCPDRDVTRGEVAAFFSRAYGLPAGKATFADTRGHLFERNVASLADAGITKGCGGGNFCPNRKITRAEFAAFVDRAGMTK